MTGARQAALAALGLLAGFGSSFLGIGGGLILVPVLVAVLGQPLKRAVGTALLGIVPIALIGVVTETIVKAANLRWGMALVLTLGSLAGSWLGGRIVSRLEEGWLHVAYAGFLVLAAWRMLAGAATPERTAAMSLAAAPFLGRAAAALAGVLAGLSSVLFGVGGGIVLVPALSLLLAEFPFHAARATSLVTILPTAAYGAHQHRRLGTVDAAIAARLIPGGLLGAVLGVIVVNRLPARPCRIAFGLFLLAAAARIVTLARRRAA